MRVFMDCTGPMGSDTGGTTYVSYMLPLWQGVGEDELTAAFSAGEVPPELASLGCVHELSMEDLPGPLRGTALAKLFDLHTRVSQLVQEREAEVAYFPANFLPFRKKLVPTVVSIRSVLSYHYPGQTTRGRRVYRRAAMGHALRVADRVIVPSSSTADDLMRWFSVTKREKLVVVPHGIDLDVFRPANSSEPAAADGPRPFAFVSKPRDYKGLATVLRALRLARDSQGARDGGPTLTIADGGLSDEQAAHWRGIVDKLGLTPFVEWRGRLDHDELSALYRSAAALVLPSSCESFGNIYLEAAACGCPVIASYGHGIDETIGPVATQVPAHSHRILAERMLESLADPESKRSEHAHELREWASKFSWERTLTETRQVLEEIT